jgi:hypothetical protein
VFNAQERASTSCSTSNAIAYSGLEADIMIISPLGHEGHEYATQLTKELGTAMGLESADAQSGAEGKASGEKNSSALECPVQEEFVKNLREYFENGGMETEPGEVQWANAGPHDSQLTVTELPSAFSRTSERPVCSNASVSCSAGGTG